MAAPRQLACGALLLIPFLAGCASAPAPVARKQPEKQVEKPAPSAATEQNPTPPAIEEPKPASADTTDVVDPGGEGGPMDLVQAAKAERERRSHSGEPVAVINDKTLPRLPKAKLTYAEPAKKKPASAPAAGDARDEEYWRGRAVEIRTRWKKTAEEVKDLEQSAAGWRRRFYAENDPYARDSQVKPEWDRVLDRLGKARAEVEETRKELEDFLEEGRRAGALPGWLREGAEDEPKEPKKEKSGPGTLEPKELPVYQQQPPPTTGQDDHGALS